MCCCPNMSNKILPGEYIGAFSQMVTGIQVGSHSRNPLKAHKAVWHCHPNLQGAAVITVPQRKPHRKSVNAPI